MFFVRRKAVFLLVASCGAVFRSADLYFQVRILWGEGEVEGNARRQLSCCCRTAEALGEPCLCGEKERLSAMKSASVVFAV